MHWRREFCEYCGITEEYVAEEEGAEELED